MSYQSFLEKGSIFFFKPFLPLERRLFLPTAIIATKKKVGDAASWWMSRLRQLNSVDNFVDSMQLSVVSLLTQPTCSPTQRARGFRPIKLMSHVMKLSLISLCKPFTYS
jgi:hypothetical protein